jgi:catechol 2,3-dioxygenase-like lactoylglutathione lyase family enzyme
MTRPPKHLGLWHVALNVHDLAACEAFYVALLGYEVEWRPDDNSVYLSSGKDNLALHKVPEGVARAAAREQALDHIGVFVPTIDDVDPWYDYLLANDVKMATQPRTHRDGARSFYCYDPDGNKVQVLYHPPISAQL